jgi:opacity protein-like surface antigen
MQFTTVIDPRFGQWLNIAAFFLSALAMASWWQDFLSAKQAAAAAGSMNLVVSTINYVLHGMPAPVAQAVQATKTLLILLAALLLALIFQAHVARAADLAVKATPAAVVCTQTACDSLYAGGNLVNSGGNFDVIGSGLTGLAANGVMLGGQAGAEFWNGSIFAEAELDVEYDIATNGAGLGAGNRAQWALGGQIKLGYAPAGLFGASTTGQAAPALPAALASSLISPYIAVGIWDRPWGVGLLTGAGVQALIAQNWTLDPEYFHVAYNNAAINPNVKQQSENDFMLALNYHFKP